MQQAPRPKLEREKKKLSVLREASRLCVALWSAGIYASIERTIMPSYSINVPHVAWKLPFMPIGRAEFQLFAVQPLIRPAVRRPRGRSTTPGRVLRHLSTMPYPASRPVPFECLLDAVRTEACMCHSR